jgi:hypothetical protein
MPATIIDGLGRGRGILAVRLFGVLPIAHFSGPALDNGEVICGPAVMPWRQFGFIDQPNLTWTTATLRATFCSSAPVTLGLR